MDGERPTICFVSSEHPPFDKRVFDKEAVSLAAAGFRVIHLCPSELDSRTLVGGVEVVTYPRRHGKLQRFLGLYSLASRARGLGADAYHCNEPDSWVVGIVMRYLHRSVVVFDCHEHYPGQVVRWLPRGTRRMGAWVTRYGLQVLALVTDRIVLAKNSLADDFSWSRAKQLVVLNTTSVQFLYDALKEDPMEKRVVARGSEDQRFRFVHLGVIRRERGSEHLLAALSELRRRGHADVGVVIVGEFKDGSERDFFTLAESLGVQDCIEFHRWMPFDAAFALVRQCDAGLVLFQRYLANNVRALPHKMFDYMLAGLPVVAPEFAPDVVAVIKGAACGVLVDTSNVRALTDAMERLMTDRTWATALGRRGQEAVLNEYNWERESAKLIEMYRAMLRSDRMATVIGS